MADKLSDTLKKEAKAFKREFARQTGGFVRETVHQASRGWAEEFMRQVFGGPRRQTRRGRGR